jgi:glutathione S-transferase
MRLYQFPYSPFAAKVRKCLELKRLDFEVVDVPYLDRRQLIELTGGSVQIPVLVDGSHVISESAMMTAYLDEKYAPSLRAGPSAGPAVVFEQWADAVLEDVVFRWSAPAIEDRIGDWNGGRADARAFYRLIKERKYGAGCLDLWRSGAADLSRRAAQLLAPLCQTLESRPYLLGEVPTLADAAVWGQLNMVEQAMPGSARRIAPTLNAWYLRLEA